MKRWSALLYSVFTFFIIGGVYFFCLPHTVQMGDTGELVAAANGLLVAHPPGYPLFLWLQALFIKIVNLDTVFWRASLLSMGFSVSSLIFLWKTFKEHRLSVAGCVLLLAFSRIFWRYSVLPDVFALNVLFVAVILYFYLAPQRENKSIFWIPFLFLLGLTNHHTLLFLFPIVLDNLWTHRFKKAQILAMALGLISFAGVYSSLLFLQTDSLYSWGNLSSLSNLLGHMLRSDYGTFQLMGSNQSGSALENYLMLGRETLFSFYPLLIAIPLLIAFKAKLQAARKEMLVALSLVLYGGIFFALANNSHLGFLSEVFDRFLIFFQVLLVFLVLAILQKAKLSNLGKNLIAGFLILCSVYHCFRWSQENNFSKNTVVEDYVVNLLNEAHTEKQTIAILPSDTRYFATRYAQTVLGVRPDILVLSPKGLFFPWYTDKIQRRFGLNLKSEEIQKRQQLDIEEDLILPNLSTFDFITPMIFTNSNRYQLTILPLGRRLSQGQGIAFGAEDYSKMIFRSSADDIHSNPKRYNVFRELLSDYALFPLIQGKEMLRQGQAAQARSVLKQTLINIPWCTPAAQEICSALAVEKSENKESCDRSVEELKQKYFNYFY